MPTFRNNGKQRIVYKGMIQEPNERMKEVLVFFDAGEEVKLNFWVPYEELGLELVSAESPITLNTVLVSGTFSFDEGTERKFAIGHCDRYVLHVLSQKGKIKIYPGSSDIGAEVRADTEVPFHYHVIYDWEYAPYLRVVGLEDGTEATIHAEVYRPGNREIEEWH
ncbi:MAG: hypothetical protein IJM68_00600 [Synergistaceae bacterium]|nr:hypothetical protein [Synergistaceae bacterium]